MYRLMTALLLTLSIATTAMAASIGTITAVSGTVEILKKGRGPARPATAGMGVEATDGIRTRGGATADIYLLDGSHLIVSPGTRINLSAYSATPKKTTIDMTRGKLRNIVPAGLYGPSGYEVKTCNAVAGVRGTDFTVIADTNYTEVFVTEGTVLLTNKRFADASSGGVLLTADTFSSITGTAAPLPPAPFCNGTSCSPGTAFDCNTATTAAQWQTNMCDCGNALLVNPDTRRTFGCPPLETIEACCLTATYTTIPGDTRDAAYLDCAVRMAPATCE